MFILHPSTTVSKNQHRNIPKYIVNAYGEELGFEKLFFDKHTMNMAIMSPIIVTRGPFWNYLSIPKLQRLHRWSLGMET